MCSFRYDNALHLREDVVSAALGGLQHQRKAADQVYELSERGNAFFCQVFKTFDRDGDGALSPQELEEVFSTCPHMPENWQRADFSATVETARASTSTAAETARGRHALTLKGFLSLWDITTMQSPKTTLLYV